jgi:hypothetical protein
MMTLLWKIWLKVYDLLEIVDKKDDGHETIKLVLCKHGDADYELGEDEHFVDDLEQDMDWRQRIDDAESEEGESEEEESDEDVGSD